MKMSRYSFLFCTALLSACSFGNQKPDALYVLNPTARAASCRSAVAVQVELPEANPGLEVSRIAIFTTPDHINYYTGVRWAAQVPIMLQTFLTSALDTSHAFKSASLDTDNVRPDRVIMPTIRDFQVEQSNGGQVHLHITTKILNARTHALMRTVDTDKTIAPVANHMPDIVQAFNAASDAAAADIIAGLLQDTKECKHAYSQQ